LLEHKPAHQVNKKWFNSNKRLAGTSKSNKYFQTYSPYAFSCRFKKDQQNWTAEELPDIITNYEEDVAMLYITNQKGKIFGVDLVKVLPTLKAALKGIVL